MQARSRRRGEGIEALKRRAIGRARVALGLFGSGIAHVVVKPFGEERCRRFVVTMRLGFASVKEASV